MAGDKSCADTAERHGINVGWEHTMESIFTISISIRTVKHNLGIYMHRITNNQLPHLNSILPNSNFTRFALNKNLLLPKVCANYGKQTIYFSGISSWNCLPFDLKASRSLDVVKTKLKNHTMSTS